MNPKLRSMLGRVARRASSPFRSFFNHHFAMVKQEVTTSRDQLLVGSVEVQRTAARVAESADKVEESTTFLAARLGRLMERQESVETAVAALDARTVTALASLAARSDADALWCAFAARSLCELPAGSRVLVTDDAGSVAATLVSLGYSVVGPAALAAAPGPVDAIVGHEATAALSAADSLVPDGLVVVSASFEPVGDGFTTVASVRDAGGVIVAARRAGASAQPRLR